MDPPVNTRVYIACLVVMFVAVGPIVVMMLNLMREDNVDMFVGVFVAFFLCISIMMFAWRRRVSTDQSSNDNQDNDVSFILFKSYFGHHHYNLNTLKM